MVKTKLLTHTNSLNEQMGNKTDGQADSLITVGLSHFQCGALINSDKIQLYRQRYF